MSVTLKDIAEALGISVTTVSRALNGQGRISSATRERVLQKALEMGYDVKPGLGRRDDTRHICIVFNARLQSLSGDPFYSTVMVGVENECQKYGYKVFLQTIGKPDDRTVRELHQAVRVDGLIFVGADVYPSIVRQAKQYGIPAVLIDNWMPEMAVDAVVTDNRGG